MARSNWWNIEWYTKSGTDDLDSVVELGGFVPSQKVLRQ